MKAVKKSSWTSHEAFNDHKMKVFKKLKLGQITKVEHKNYHKHMGQDARQDRHSKIQRPRQAVPFNIKSLP